MNPLSLRDESTRNAWRQALSENLLLYPDERVVSFLARRFPPNSGNESKLALDVGCGSGRHIKLMLDYGFQTLGIDYIPESIQIVESTFSEHGRFKGVTLGDFRNHKFQHQFDAIVAWGVIFNAPPPEIVSSLRVLGQLLTPNGRMLVNFRTKDNYLYGKGKQIESDCFILDERAGSYKGACYTFTDLAEVEALVASAGGLKIVNVEKTTFLKNNLQELHSWLQVELVPVIG
jgi:SAM-dependent methyltransferase